MQRNTQESIKTSNSDGSVCSLSWAQQFLGWYLHFWVKSKASERLGYLIEFWLNSARFFAVWRIHFYLTLPSLVFMNAYDFVVVSKIDFIRCCVVEIQKNLIQMKHTRMALVDRRTRNDCSELTRMKRDSYRVHHLAGLINRRYGLSLLTTTTSKLTFLIIDIYWVYVRASHGYFDSFLRKWMTLVECNRIHLSSCHHRHFTSIFGFHHHVSTTLLNVASLLLCFPPLVSLIVIFTSSSSASTEYTNIAFFLHQLKFDENNDDDEVKELEILHRFSLQLAALKVDFNAKGFFTFNNSTLCEVGDGWDANEVTIMKSMTLRLIFNFRFCQPC